MKLRGPLGRRLLAPDGKLVISFGPPWKHPFGAHLNGWIGLPWIHFFFDEPPYSRCARPIFPTERSGTKTSTAASIA